MDDTFNMPEQVRIELYDDDKGWTGIPNSYATINSQGLRSLVSPQFDNIQSPRQDHITENSPERSSETENTLHFTRSSLADLIMSAPRSHSLLIGPSFSGFGLGIYGDNSSEKAPVEHTLHSPPILIEQFPLPSNQTIFGGGNHLTPNMLDLGWLEENGGAEELNAFNGWLDLLPSKSLIRALDWEIPSLAFRGTSDNRRRVNRLGGISQALMIEAAGAFQRLGLISPSQRSISPLRLVKMLNLKFLGKDIELEEERTRQLMSTDDYCRLKFTQFLLTGMVNGMVDFDEIPQEFLAGVLTPDRRLNSLLCSFLQSASKHLVKVIISKVFQSAIHHGNCEIVSYFLEEGFNVINKVELLSSLPVNPIEAAAMRGEEAVLEILLRDRTIIDMSSSDNLCRALTSLSHSQSFHQKPATPQRRYRLISDLLHASPAAAYYVLSDWSPRSPVRPTLNRLAQLEVEATQCQTMGSRDVVNPSLWLHFLRVPRSQHSVFFKDGVWVCIMRHAKGTHAASLVNKVVADCTAQHNGACLSTAQDHLDHGLIEALGLGKVEAFYAMLPYSTHSASGDSRLLSAAIKSGNYTLISDIMRQNPDINPPPRDTRLERTTTPLEECIKSNNENLLNHFIEAGIMKYLGGRGDNCRFKGPLHAAVEKGRNDLVIRLLDTMPDPELSSLGEALQCALETGNEALILTLISKGASIYRSDDNESRDWRNMLHRAVQMRNAVVIRQLLETGSLAIYRGSERKPQSMIEELVGMKRREMMVDLLSCHHYAPRYMDFKWKNREEVPTSDWDGFLPALEDKDLGPLLLESKLATVQFLTACLALAISRQKHRLAQELINRGANTWNTEVMRSASRWWPAILPLLLEGPKVVLTRGSRTEILKFFINEGPSCEAAIRTLLGSKIVDLHDTGNCGNKETALTPLGVAILQGNKFPQFSYDTVISLLDRKCDPNSIVEFKYEGYSPFLNQTALLKAIEVGNIDLVKLLLQRGARVKDKLPYYVIRTPLQKAAETGNLEIVRLLIIEHGADVNAEPSVSRGGTAIQLAAISGDCIVAAELLKHGALLYKPPSKIAGRWPIEGAAEHGRLDMIQFLWTVHQNTYTIEDDNGFQDKNIRKAMRLAATNKHFGCRDLIAELAGLPVTATDLPPEPSPMHIPWPPPGWNWDA
ncbi:hypothetical protein F5B18DRAFT_594388 [Nemania serpens]|nr:hypothetical protein F5B18DRAFT_594388 [Nemania serpens]